MCNVTEEFKTRFHKALSLRGMKPSELSEKTGISKSTISHYMSGYTKPKSDKLFVLAKALDVDEAWLMGLNVPMEREIIIIDAPDPNNEINVIISKSENGEQLTADEQEKISNHLKSAFPQLLKTLKEFGYSLFEAQLKESFQQLNDENKAKVVSYSKNLFQIQRAEEEQLHSMPQAAHERTDIKVTDKMRKHDDDLMDNDDLWK